MDEDWGSYPNEYWDLLTLRFPHDQDAIRAQFEFDDQTLSLNDSGFGVPWTSVVRGGDTARPKAELVERWQAARRQWWAEWDAGPQHRTRLGYAFDDMSRVVPRLEPVIVAEDRRANRVKDYWHAAEEWSQWAGWLVRRLMYPVDADALRAQFAFDDDVRLGCDRVVSERDHAVLLAGTFVPTRDQSVARRRWWQDWSAAPQPSLRLSALGSVS